MQNDLTTMLKMKLEDVAKSPFVRLLNESPKTELIEDRFYMELRSSGIAFVANLDGRVMMIQFHAEGYQGYNAFAGELPEGLSFTENRRAIQSRLGQPSASGGGTVIQFIGKTPKWDRFDRPSSSLHLQYADNEKGINLVSLMRPDAIPK